MRLTLATLFLTLGLAPQVHACCGDETIKFPGVVRQAVLRGDHLFCLNDAGRIVVVDLRLHRSFELGGSVDRRWHDGDVLNGRAMLIEKDRLHVIGLRDAKKVHDIALGNDFVSMVGFVSPERAFIHRGKSLAIIELATGKTLHQIELGDEPWRRVGSAAWQKVGKRLYIPGPATTLCVIDLDAGKILERISVDSRAGIHTMHVEGSSVYCIGTPFGWGFRNDHFVSVDLESKTCRHFDLPQAARGFGRFASGPYGTVYFIDGDRIDRFSMAGERISSCTMPGHETVLGVWRQLAIVGRVNEIALEDVRETPVARR